MPLPSDVITAVGYDPAKKGVTIHEAVESIAYTKVGKYILNRYIHNSPFDLILVGPPGTGKTTVAFWLTMMLLQIVGAKIEVLGYIRDARSRAVVRRVQVVTGPLQVEDAVALIRALHPRDYRELVMLYTAVGGDCGNIFASKVGERVVYGHPLRDMTSENPVVRFKLPFLFVDDVIPHWDMFSASKETRTFYRRFWAYHRAVTDYLMLTTQFDYFRRSSIPTLYYVRTTSLNGRYGILISRRQRIMITNMGGKTNVEKLYDITFIPWNKKYELYSVAPDLHADLENTRSNLLSFNYADNEKIVEILNLTCGGIYTNPEYKKHIEEIANVIANVINQAHARGTIKTRDEYAMGK